MAGCPVDGRLDGTHDLVVVQYELAQRCQIADGVSDGGEAIQFAQQKRTGAHENLRWSIDVPIGFSGMRAP